MIRGLPPLASNAELGQTAQERGGFGVRLPIKVTTLSMYIEYVLRKE